MTTMWPTLANQAAAGCMAGSLVNRQYANNAAGTALTPANQASHATSAEAFGAAFDVALAALYNADGSPPAGLVPVGGIVESEDGGQGFTQVASGALTTAAETNVALTYPCAVFGICQAIVNGRGLTKNKSGVVFALADWEASGIPATAAAQFYEFLKAGIVSLA
jgi:hypothetical protein